MMKTLILDINSYSHSKNQMSNSTSDMYLMSLAAV